MITHDLIQGSDEWHQFRLEHFGASEAAAMLGLSKKVTRTELLHMKSTGTAREFSDWVQKNILDYGHEVEALARPIIEEIFGIDLYPVTCSNGILSASCDGLTLCESDAFEHKQPNKELVASVQAGIVPDEHMPQCQQIMMVTGAKRVIFTVSDGTRENMAKVEVFADYAWFERIRAGWEQFAKDLAAYVPFEVIEPAKAPAAKDLPAVTIQVRGELTMSNLSDVTPLFDRFLAEAKTNLVTDDDFALAESQSKTGRETAKRCKLTAKAVIDQISTVSEAVRTLEEYAAKFDALALSQEKAVKDQKEARKTTAKAERDKAYADHVAGINTEISPITLVLQNADKPNFAGVMKGQRMLSSIYDKLDTELARVKIAADAVAKDVRSKLAWHKENTAGYGFLFSDMQQIVFKEVDDFQMLVQNRIAQHKENEAKKLEAERARIQAEEETKARAKAEAEVRAKAVAEAQAQAIAERARIAADKAVKAAEPQSAPSVAESRKPTPINTRPTGDSALAALARHELVCFRKKYAAITELSPVMREIDAYLNSQQTAEARRA